MGEWSACNKILPSCDKKPMHQSRHRLCSSSNKDSKNEDSTRTPTCTPVKLASELRFCPCSDLTTENPDIHALKSGKWSNWSQWSSCNSNSCTESRHRKCFNKYSDN